MTEFIQLPIPDGRPKDATHYNPRYTLCWEKQLEGSDKVYVYNHVNQEWCFPVNRSGGHRIHTS